MFLSRIETSGQTRNWCQHGDGVPGVHLTPWPHNDLDECYRFGGAFVRPLCREEITDAPLRPLEQPVAVVQRTCNPKMVKRHFRAARPDLAPWPADPRDDFHLALDRALAAQWRRI
jgi:hypothetical protein